MYKQDLDQDFYETVLHQAIFDFQFIICFPIKPLYTGQFSFSF